MNRWIGTRAEREWLAALRRIADALEALAEEMRRTNDGEGEEEGAR